MRTSADKDTEVTAGKYYSHPYCTGDNYSVGRLHTTAEDSVCGHAENRAPAASGSSENTNGSDRTESHKCLFGLSIHSECDFPCV